jgi:hypothetical protein
MNEFWELVLFVLLVGLWTAVVIVAGMIMRDSGSDLVSAYGIRGGVR